MAHALALPTRPGQRHTGPLQTRQLQTGRLQFGRLQVGAKRLELDGSRIIANAGALAVNAMVLLLLLAPVTLPSSSPPLPREPDLIWLRPKVEPQPIVMPVLKQPKQQQPAHATQPRPTPPQIERPAADSRPEDIRVPPADPVVRADPGDTIDLQPSLATSTALQPIAAPAPHYPAEAIRAGLTGTVELEILVGIDGKPLEVRVVHSSGHRVLDQAARQVVLSRWRFQPAMQDGHEVQALGRVPIVFTLER